MLTPEELRQIRRVSLQAGRKVDSLFAGGYRSAFKGRGMEFEEVRGYVPGDDVRHIDWNVTARSQEPHIKEFREERELTLMLGLDVSGSVRFGSGGRDGRTDKRLQQARLAAALAYAAIRNNDKVGLLAFTDHVEHLVPPRKTRGHVWQVIRSAFEPLGQRRGTDLGGALVTMGRALSRRAVVCLISDFMVLGDLRAAVAPLAARHRVHAFVLTDPVEERRPPVGLVELEDAETGERRLVDAEALGAAWTVGARVDALRRAGVHTSVVSTTDDPFRVLQLHFQRVGAQR